MQCIYTTLLVVINCCFPNDISVHFPSTRLHWAFWLCSDCAQNSVLWLVQHPGNIKSESKQLFRSVFCYQLRWFSPRTFLLHMVNWPVQSSADQFKTKGDLVIRTKKWQHATVFTFFLFVPLYLSAYSTSPPAFPLALASISNTVLFICLFLDFAEFCPLIFVMSMAWTWLWRWRMISWNEREWWTQLISVSAAQKLKCWMKELVQWLSDGVSTADEMNVAGWILVLSFRDIYIYFFLNPK